MVALNRQSTVPPLKNWLNWSATYASLLKSNLNENLVAIIIHLYPCNILSVFFLDPTVYFFTDQNPSCWWMFESLFWKSPIGICWNVWSKNRQMGKTTWSAISTEWGQNGAFGWSSNNFWRLWWSNSKWTFDPISWQIEGMDPTSYNSNENS